MKNPHFVVAKNVQKNVTCSWVACPYCNLHSITTSMTLNTIFLSFGSATALKLSETGLK